MANAAVIALIIAIIVIICMIGCCCWYIKRSEIKLKSMISKKDPYDKVSEENEAEVMDNGHSHDNDEYEAGATITTQTNRNRNGFETFNGEEEDEDNDIDDKRYELQQWFKDNVDLSDEEVYKYVDMFIQNGYDVISAFRYIDRNELDSMGIEKRGHQKNILEAIKKYNGL